MDSFEFLLSYLQHADRPLTVAIDGRCAAGKTTLADRVGRALQGQCNIVHTDDFYLPFACRSADSEQRPAGHMDIERLKSEILLPLSNGNTAIYRPYNCHEDRFLPSVRLDAAKCTIIEGSYSCHPQLRALYDLRIFLDIPKAEQLARLANRDPAALPAFQSRWIPKEELYFIACQVRENCDKVF